MANIPEDIFAGWHVVIVDDEPDSLYLAEYILQFYKAIVHSASNGIEAIGTIEAFLPRFVISDLSMPEFNGWMMLKSLQANPKTQHIPVIALTAHSMVGDREKVLEAGFQGYLAKPIEVNAFIIDLLRILMTVPALATQLGDIDLE